MSDVVELLRDEQERRCAYGTRDGDGRTCDCKFANPLWPFNREATGCPELRAALDVLRSYGPTALARDEDRLRESVSGGEA